ncbi:hypothetical protein BJY52DRAFT_1316056 [Lactarius psammicola]|nr:hypothetical protein BJY52DRAFT_1316056 [Lactarius psammicola]
MSKILASLFSSTTRVTSWVTCQCRTHWVGYYWPSRPHRAGLTKTMGSETMSLLIYLPLFGEIEPEDNELTIVGATLRPR